MQDLTPVEATSVPSDIIAKWQDIVDVMAEILDVPTGLIMRTDGTTIEVFVSSRTEGNPYNVGDREKLVESGLYCEWVISNQTSLLVADAPSDEHWCTNPDIELNMVSYLGYPIIEPSGAVFGTICVLDTKPNEYSERYLKLVEKFRGIAERDLELLALNKDLEKTKEELEAKLAEIKTLRGVIPICSHCKKVRDDEGYWDAVESYISRHSEALFSHALCVDCAEDLYPGVFTEAELEDLRKESS